MNNQKPNKKIKVGLISTQFAINYGAVLQALSLYKTLSKFYDVEVVHYYPTGARYGHYDSYSFKGIKNIILSLCKIFNFKYRANATKKRVNFLKFLNKEFRLTNVKFSSYQELKEAEHKYDVFFVGSDQVWNRRVIDDDTFYLKFVNNQSISKVSYAASIGDTLDEELLQRLANDIEDFERISLREETQSKELSQLVNKNVSVLIDPVFLSTKNEWEQIAVSSTLVLDEPYILVYEVNSPPSFSDYVKKLKQLFNLKVIEISNRPLPKSFSNKRIGYAGPDDYTKLFLNAEFVLTSSFHGVAFSCLFNKNFACALSSERSIRQKNLLENLGLKSRQANKVEDLKSIYGSSIDWSSVNNEIENLRAAGFQYIEEVGNVC